MRYPLKSSFPVKQHPVIRSTVTRTTRTVWECDHCGEWNVDKSCDNCGNTEHFTRREH